MPARLLTVALAAWTTTLAQAPSALAAPSWQAPASTCEADEVTVVVDFNELARPTLTACAAAGASAARTFEAAGVPLTYASTPGMQGFVCTVDALPSDRSCTAGDSYWSLWWTDGSRTWSYATLGVDQLDVPAGGYVGFAWHQGSGSAEAPDHPVGEEPDGGPATGTTGAASAADEGDAGGTSSDGDDADAPNAADDGDALPVALGVALVVLVLGAAAAVPVLRRRRG